MLSVEPGEGSQGSREGGQEDVAGEVAGLEFSFLTTRGPHLSGDSLFPDHLLSYPQYTEATGNGRDPPSHSPGGAWGGGRGQF